MKSDDFAKLLRKSSVPQLNALKQTIKNEYNSTFKGLKNPSDLTYGEQMKMIEKEIQTAKRVGNSTSGAIPRNGKLFGGRTKPYTES
jgi:hypothetical protein